MPGPAANRLLDALDAVLNSNSFLLEDPVSADTDIAAALTGFFASGRFRELLVQADAERGWHNYTAHDVESGTSAAPLDERFYVGANGLSISELSWQALRDELVSLLTTAKSPHHKQMTAPDANTLVEAYAEELFGQAGARSSTSPDGWQFFRVAPDFLRASGYGGTGVGNRDDGPTYFDGGALDRCLVMRHGGALHVLLTNGAP